MKWALEIGRIFGIRFRIHWTFLLLLLFVFYGIFFNWWLALIGIFLYLGADSEKQHVLLRSVLHEVPASRAMATRFETLAPEEPLSRCLEHVFHGCQEDFPVAVGGELRGILTRTGLISAVHEGGVETPVGDAMDTDFVAVVPGKALDDVYGQLMARKKTVAAVVDEGRLLGLLSLEGIGRFFMVRSAIQSGPRPEGRQQPLERMELPKWHSLPNN